MKHHFHMVQKPMRRHPLFKFLGCFLPGGFIVSLRIRRFSSLSRMNLDSALSGGELMKLNIVISCRRHV